MISIQRLFGKEDRFFDLLIASAALMSSGVLWLGLAIGPSWPGALLLAGGIAALIATLFHD